MAALILSFCWPTTSLPRSTHWFMVSRSSRPRVFRYSLPSCAEFLMASRVSRPERGAYSTPSSAPKPRPARNHIKLLVLSLSDIRRPPQSSDGNTQNSGGANSRKANHTCTLGCLDRAPFTTSLQCIASHFTHLHQETCFHNNIKLMEV